MMLPVEWFDPFSARYPLPWEMRPAERLALIALLAALRPACAIAIGAANGGSLQVLAAAANHVYVLDADPPVPGQLAHLSNVDFLIGDSRDTLPGLLIQLHQ